MSRIRIDPSTRMPFVEETNPKGIHGERARDDASSARDGASGIAGHAVTSGV